MKPRTSPLRSIPPMGLRGAMAVASFAAFGVLATACSSETTINGASSAETTVAPVTSETVAPPATVAPDTTVAPTTVAPTLPPPPPTVAPSVPPTVPPEGCAVTNAPSGSAVQVTPISGDFNGDGVTDNAVSWGEPTGGGATWFVRTEINGGPASTFALGDLGVGFAALLDRVDVDYSLGAPDGSNEDELLAIVGSNASGYNLGVFGIGADGCIFQFDDGAGGAFSLAVSGTVSMMSGVGCDGGAGSQFLIARQATTDDGIGWQVSDTRIDRSGQTLTLGVTAVGALSNDDPILPEYGEATCNGNVYIGAGGDY